MVFVPFSNFLQSIWSKKIISKHTNWHESITQKRRTSVAVYHKRHLPCQKLCFITALSYLGQNTNETVLVILKYCVNRRFKSKCFRFSKLRKCNLAVLQTVSGLVSWCSNRLWPSYFRIIIPFHMCTKTSKKSTTFDKIPRFANIIIDVRKKDPSKKFMIAYKTICHTINND